MKIKSGTIFFIYLLLTVFVSWLVGIYYSYDGRWDSASTSSALIIFVVLLVLGVIVYRKRNQLKTIPKSLLRILNPPIQEVEKLEGKIWYRGLKVLYILAYFFLPFWFWSKLFHTGYYCSQYDIRGRCAGDDFNLVLASLTLLGSIMISLVLLYILRRMTFYIIFGSKK